MQMRITSDLPDSTELVIQRTIGAAIEVHKALGPGLLEGVYSDAMAIELEFRELKFARGCRYLLSYLRASKIRAGLLLNFNKLLMKEGIKRLVN